MKRDDLMNLIYDDRRYLEKRYSEEIKKVFLIKLRLF